MSDRDKANPRKLDQVDRRSQVGVSRALRSRDVSRPSRIEVAEALKRLESTPLPPRPNPQRRKAEEAPRSPRTD